MFDSAASSYIRTNKVITFGQDQRWRQAAADIIEARSDNDKILDICTGTADLALKIAKKFPRLKIYALDYSPNMLAVAKKRADACGLHNIIFKEGDFSNMEFENGSFDYVTISFGFRNLSFYQENLKKTLRQIHRILKPGGRFIIIETSHPPNRFLRGIFHFYAARIIPILGGMLSGEHVPYAYLGSSILKFFNRDELIDVVESAGLREEKLKPFMFGAILLCVFQK